MNYPVIKGFQNGDQFTLNIDVSYPIQYIHVFSDNRLVGTFAPAPVFNFPTRNEKSLTIICTLTNGCQYASTFLCGSALRFPQNDTTRDFKAGDILVASDNFEDFLPQGYMGHSAIVMDENFIIEAVASHPQVKKSSISDFLTEHPVHVQYRCIDQNQALKAKDFAVNFLNEYSGNLNQGVAVPPFSFSLQIPLDDLKTGLYCSKLVWHSYYQGANIVFENDHLLFAPEDLAANLENDNRFKLIYTHPEFGFKIDL